MATPRIPTDRTVLTKLEVSIADTYQLNSLIRLEFPTPVTTANNVSSGDIVLSDKVQVVFTGVSQLIITSWENTLKVVIGSNPVLDCTDLFVIKSLVDSITVSSLVLATAGGIRCSYVAIADQVEVLHLP